MENPAVSVIIPAYNSSRYLRDCLESLKRQTFHNFEVIVVDDGSKDDTAQIARSYGAIVLRNPRNMGEGASRNHGVKIARGQTIVHSDSDVVMPETWLAKIVADMDRYQVKCVTGGYLGALGNSFIENFSHHELFFRRRNFPEFVKTTVSNNLACDREIFLASGGFPDKYKCEDMVLSYKISRNNLIYRDRDNGVYHHFRDTLSGYLKQQYFFARDTLVVYGKNPGLFLVKTHQGHRLHLEVLLVYLFYVLLFLRPLFSPLPLILIGVINVDFLIYLNKNNLPWFKSLVVVYLRDFMASFGLIAGGLCLTHDLFQRQKLI